MGATPDYSPCVPHALFPSFARIAPSAQRTHSRLPCHWPVILTPQEPFRCGSLADLPQGGLSPSSQQGLHQPQPAHVHTHRGLGVCSWEVIWICQVVSIISWGRGMRRGECVSSHEGTRVEWVTTGASSSAEAQPRSAFRTGLLLCLASPLKLLCLCAWRPVTRVISTWFPAHQ